MKMVTALKDKMKNMNKKSRIAGAVLVCLVLAGLTVTVYSKYYKTGYNKGMAIASGFYFSSNYMAALEDSKGIDMDSVMEEIVQNYLDSIVSSANRTPWMGTNVCDFHMEIRNFDNQLLFNDKDLNVEYRVEFMLLDEPRGASYSIKFQDVAKQLEWKNGKGTVASFTGELPGGLLSADQYNLGVAMQDVAGYVPARVLMAAYPIGPDYLVNTKCIAGIVKANYEEKEFKIEAGSGFTVTKTTEYEDNWEKAVRDESGFVYQLITTGSYTGTGNTSTRKKIRLKWRSDMYKINKNDEHYINLQKEPDFNDKYKTEVDDKGIEWQIMEIEVMPYASIKFVFFRNPGSDTEPGFEDIIADMDKNAFEKSVTAEVIP
ncbi:MAG: hypothetical protein K2O16_15945 [Lachnospiraceae bacterium]|nr:hypothetical protein [Lachnospiraceae bacterium]